MADNRQSNRNRISWFRRGIQIICFIFLPSLFILIFNSIKSLCMLLFHGQGTIQTIMPGIILLVVVTLVTAVVGRFFCGWMCAFGTMGDFLYRLPRIRHKTTVSYGGTLDGILKWCKYILLLFIIIVIWGFQFVTIPQGVNPWDLFGILASFNLSSLSVLVNGWIPAGILLLVIIVASFFVERFFCRYLCPLGAYLGFISKLRGINVLKKREYCGKCRLCTKKCSMGLSLDQVDVVRTGECIQCMECVKVCPRDNAHIELEGMHLNVVVAAVVSCILLSSGYYVGKLYTKQSSNQEVNQETIQETIQDTGTNTADVTSELSGVAVNVADGVYTGTGTGFRGEITVTVTVLSGKIKKITIDSYQDDEEFFDHASNTIIQEIEKNQSVEVDAVSGATYSSNGIKEAVANALNVSYAPSEVQDRGHGRGHRH